MQYKYTSAEQLYVKSLESQRRVLGETHAETLISMKGLAAVLFGQGKYSPAEVLLAKVLDISRRVHGKEHLETAASVGNLAAVYHIRGKFAQAEPLYAKAIELATRLRRRLGGEAARRRGGEDNPDSLKYKTNLAELYGNQSKYADAELLYGKALQGLRRVLGEKHRSNLYTMNSLAALFVSKGKFSDGEQLYTRALAIERSVGNNEHPFLLTSLNGLAEVRYGQRKYTEAEALFSEVLQARRRGLGDEHPDTLVSMSRLGELYAGQGQYAQAECLLTKVLEVRSRVLSPQHPDTAKAAAALSALRARQSLRQQKMKFASANLMAPSKSPQNLRHEKARRETIVERKDGIAVATDFLFSARGYWGCVMSSDASVARPMAANAEELCQQLDRILASPEFAGALRQQAFLRFVISEMIAGRGHEIKETLVAMAVYEKAPDYDPRIDSTVRVEASKLRLRLQHYYQGAGSADPLRISIPKGSYQPKIELAPAVLAKPSTNWRRAFFLTAAMLAAMSTAVLAWRWHLESTRGPDPSRMKLTRLTESASFSAEPALSPKADFTVYTSDRDSGGVLNLWRQESDGRPPVRLTRSAFNHNTPAVSGDGKTLVFRTAQGGGMLARMPVAGGEPQLVRDSSGGRNPRYAPLGSSIVYWVPQDEQTADYGRVFLDPLGVKYGPAPVRLFGDFAHAAFPLWSEAGTHVLTLGTWHSDVPQKEFDAWVVELKGLHSEGSPKKTGLFPALQAAGLYVGTDARARVEIADWRDDWLYLTLPMGESLDLFRIRLRPGDGAVSGEPQRLTFGTGNVKSPRVAPDGPIVFARDDITYDLYSLGLSPGKSPAQDLRRHTSETGQSFRPSVHPSGSVGVWEKGQVGFRAQVWFFDLLSGNRLNLGFGGAADTRICSHALISPDGRWAAYRVAQAGVQPIYRQPVTGGPAKLICDNCGTPSDFTSDGRHMFYVTGGRPAIIGILDIASGQHADLIKHPSYNLYGARARLNASGDGWVVFYADNGVRTHQIFLTPMRAFQPASQEEWIPITDGAHWDQAPAWAPDGRTLYYVNRHDGFACIMARAIDPVSGQPSGVSWTVRHFHSSSQTLMRSMNRRGVDALWVAGERIFFTLDTRSSDLWKISVLGRSN